MRAAPPSRRQSALEVRRPRSPAASSSDGREALEDGGKGVAADAVLDAADAEKRSVTVLADDLGDLTTALSDAERALTPALQTVRDRLDEAELAGLIVDDSSVRPQAGRSDVDQTAIDLHARTIHDAIDTLRSLDEHYAARIDEVAAEPWPAAQLGVRPGSSSALSGS